MSAYCRFRFREWIFTAEIAKGVRREHGEVIID